MSEQSSIATLEAASKNVRATCTGPDCKSLIAALDAVDKAIEAYEPAGGSDEPEPKTLKASAEKAREVFAASRSGSSK